MAEGKTLDYQDEKNETYSPSVWRGSGKAISSPDALKHTVAGSFM